MKKYSDLYNFGMNVLLERSKRNDIISQQENFLRNLMNSGGFDIFLNVSKPKKKSNYKAEDF